MPTRCNIVFDNNPDRIYYAGQTLSGTATVDVREEFKVRSKLQFFQIYIFRYM
jgi:hypothetical protein